MSNMVEVEFMGKKYLVNSIFMRKESVIENNSYLNLVNHMTAWHVLEPKAVGAKIECVRVDLEDNKI